MLVLFPSKNTKNSSVVLYPTKIQVGVNYLG